MNTEQTPRSSESIRDNLIIQAERRRRELWTYLAVSLFAIEMLIVVGALFYSFISANGKGAMSFPWLAWVASSIAAPAIVILAVHLAGVGLFRPYKRKENEDDWEKHLPEKLQRAYRIIARAPAVVLLGGLITLGAMLLTVDSALHALEAFFVMFQPYLLHILGGLAALLALFGLGAFWLTYRTRRLMAEYQYRREVLHQTGLVIVDPKSRILHAGEEYPGGYAILEATPASTAIKALPEAADADFVTVPEQPENNAPTSSGVAPEGKQ